MARPSPAPARLVTDTVLAAHAPPPVAADDDKEARGRVLVVGGSAETPGSVLLGGLAALRAGAGKLQVVTAAAVAAAVAVALPEARVVGVAATPGGGLSFERTAGLEGLLGDADAVLLGPGLLGGPGEAAGLIPALLEHVGGEATVVLDAGAIQALRVAPELLAGRRGRAVVTANAGELATALGEEYGEPADRVRRAAGRFGAAVACGRFTGDASGVFRDLAGGPGLGTSGSGDVRAGIVVGLAARGASPLAAALWGAHLHARAGDRLAERIGPVGFVARELLDEIPRELAALTARLEPARPAATGAR